MFITTLHQGWVPESEFTVPPMDGIIVENREDHKVLQYMQFSPNDRNIVHSSTLFWFSRLVTKTYTTQERNLYMGGMIKWSVG